MTDWTAPIIIVGPGRSGTSLLQAMLRELPDVFTVGETNFLVKRLWDALNAYGHERHYAPLVKNSRTDWAELSWLHFQRDVMDFKGARAAPATRDVFAAKKIDEDARRARLTGQFLGEAMCPPELRRPRWVIKEIWAGSDSFLYTWDLYHQAFPNALFVQSLRHPLAYGSSYLARSAPDPTEEQALYALTQWVQMVRHNMSLAATGRYFQYRLEDLVAAPEAVFSDICSFLKLSPIKRCFETMVRNYPGERVVGPELSPDLLDQAPGVRALMEELGYE